MAVPEQTPYIEHTGNGVTTSFSLGFQCESKDHLIVLVDEIEPPIATWSLTGGNVVFTTAPAAGKKIAVQRNTPFSRNVDYQSYNNSFRPPAVNKDFDWIWWKLQELGIADWLMKLYVDRLHREQKEYIDQKDDELKNYLIEEIRKQGVALDQLDEYYNYLMERLAQIAVDKGWDASFVVDGDKTQKELNSIAVHTFDDFPVTGLTALKSILKRDDGFFYYDPSKSNVNNHGTIVNGWVRVLFNVTLTPKMFGAKADGVTNDRLSIQRMLAMTSVGCCTFDFEGLPYYVGEVTDSLTHVFKLDTIPNLNIRNATDIRVTNSMSPAGNLYCPVFLFTDCSELRAEVHVEGDVFLADGYYSGPSAVVLESSLVDAENCVIYASINKGHSAFQTVTAWRSEARPRLPTDPILRHVYIKATTNIGKYGVRLIDSGENMHLTINTHSVSRSLNLVGAKNVQAFINSHEQRNFADVLIKAYDNDVDNIYVKLNSINQTDARNPVNIEHQNTHDSSKITNVTIDAHITGRTAIKSDGLPLAVVGRSWTRTGTIAVRPSTNCVTDNIQLNFTHDAMSQPALEFPSYANNGGQVEVNFYAHVRETNNFTIKHGNTLRVSSAKNPSSQVIRLSAKHAAPTSLLCNLTLIGVEDFRNINFNNAHIKRYLAKINLTSTGGAIEFVGEPIDILNGTDWGFGLSVGGGQIIASSSRNIGTAFTKFEMLIEPIVGGNYI